MEQMPRISYFKSRKKTGVKMVGVCIAGLKKTDPTEYNRLWHLKNRDSVLEQQRARSNYINGELDPKSNPGKGFIAEMVVAKALGLESGARCNCTASFSFKYDLLDTDGYGEINVKSSKSHKRKWCRTQTWRFTLANKYKPDTYVFVAYSDDHTDIEHVWIVPAGANIVTGIKMLSISTSDYGLSRIQEYEVSNTMYNVYLHTMSIDRCSVLKSSDSISDIVAEVL